MWIAPSSQRSVEQFIEYLRMKDPERVRITTLEDIPGRNVVVYYNAHEQATSAGAGEDE